PCHLFSNDPPSTPFSPLSLHDALPISQCRFPPRSGRSRLRTLCRSGSLFPCSRPGSFPVPERWWDIGSPYLPARFRGRSRTAARSEEHTSELQSRENLVCRLLLEKKKK